MEEKQINDRIEFLKGFTDELSHFIAALNAKLLEQTEDFYIFKFKLKIREYGRTLEIQSKYLKDWTEYKEKVWQPDFVKKTAECNAGFDGMLSRAHMVSAKVDQVKASTDINSLKIILDDYSNQDQNQEKKNNFYFAIKEVIHAAKNKYKI